MNFNIKKAFDVLINNPHIMLLFVTYLLIAAGIFPIIFYNYGKPSFYIPAILLIIFTSAFFSGWFGMIKYIVKYKRTGNLEEEMKVRYHSFRNEFFSSIAKYVLPVTFYFIVLICVVYGANMLTDLIFGKPSDLLNQIASLGGDTDAIFNFISTAPKDVVAVIAQRNLFIYSTILLYFLLTFYSIPALFFNEMSANPLTGFKNGLIALFRKPLATSFLFFLIVLFHVFLIFFEALSVSNQILMFLALVLRVGFLAFVVVLIFSVYEKNFTFNCNNGTDGVGENGSCD